MYFHFKFTIKIIVDSQLGGGRGEFREEKGKQQRNEKEAPERSEKMAMEKECRRRETKSINGRNKLLYYSPYTSSPSAKSPQPPHHHFCRLWQAAEFTVIKGKNLGSHSYLGVVEPPCYWSWHHFPKYRSIFNCAITMTTDVVHSRHFFYSFFLLLFFGVNLHILILQFQPAKQD